MADSQDENDLSKSKQRHTVSFTHGQLGVGGAIVAAIMTLNPIKEWFFTREEGIAQRQNIELLRGEVISMRDEITRRLERNTDKIIDRMKETEERTARNGERLERRIDAVEVATRMKTDPKQKPN